jgi:hypothetical protein
MLLPGHVLQSIHMLPQEFPVFYFLPGHVLHLYPKCFQIVSWLYFIAKYPYPAASFPCVSYCVLTTWPCAAKYLFPSTFKLFLYCTSYSIPWTAKYSHATTKSFLNLCLLPGHVLQSTPCQVCPPT